MRCLGIDWGTKRWGLSYGDEIGIATPLPAITDATGEAKWEKLAQLIAQRRVDTIVVGYPYNMDGSVGFKAKEVDAFIASFKEQFPQLPVHRVDERLTSQVAGQAWSEKVKREQRRSGKLDSSAAALILQDFLDQELAETGSGSMEEWETDLDD